MASLEARIANHIIRLHKVKARQIVQQQRRAYYTAPGPSLLLLHGEVPEIQKREAQCSMEDNLGRQEAEAQRRSEEMRRQEEEEEEEEARTRFFEELRRQEAEAQRRSEEMSRQEEEEAQRRSEEQRRQEEEAQRRFVEELRRQEEEEAQRRSEEMRRQEEEAQRRFVEDLRRQEEAEARRRGAEAQAQGSSSSPSKARNHHGFHPYMKARSRNTEPKQQMNEKNVEDADAVNQYILRWKKLQNYTKDVRTLSFSDIPWPIKPRPSPSPPDISKEAVKAFFTDTTINLNNGVYWIKRELLRWHPDKFSTSILPIVYEDQVGQVEVTVNQVSSILADLLQDARLTSSDDA